MSTNRLDRTFRSAFIRRKIKTAFKQIEAQEEADDDNDVDVVSEDEGYNTEDDDEVDQWNFGIATMLWHIQL